MGILNISAIFWKNGPCDKSYISGETYFEKAPLSLSVKNLFTNKE
jgi:hypothetical protein